MKSNAFKAPAKINYLLDVIRRRPDGYHDLRMIMQRVDLCDEITIELTEEPGVTVACGSQFVPEGEGNIAWKAARALLDAAGSGMGARISITKNIPVAAGLGGGSSDAATVLMAMNEQLGCGFSTERLMEIGVKLGADVPFFVFGAAALAEGIGEKLTALPGLPPAWIVLVNPRVPVSTAWVYKSLQLTNERQLNTIPSRFDSIDDLCAILNNDLETVTVPAFPVIDEIKRTLIDQGAVAAMMSGSGPTVFGVFRDRERAEQACGAVLTGTGWFGAVAATL